MIDTHCHIFSEYYENIDELISEHKSSGVNRIIINGCDMKSNLEVLKLIEKYDCVYGALGFHPTELLEYDDSNLSWLENHINDKKIVAIGEIGLDYHYEDTDKIKQILVFRKQLELASRYKKPVIVHARDAIGDTLSILKEYDVRGSMHCFSGSLEMAREFIKIGFYIGIGGVCTYKNAKNIVNVIKDIDLAYILLETDSPYLSPEPYRGKKNTPSNLKIIANKISDIKGVSFENVVNITNDNTSSLFDFCE